MYSLSDYKIMRFLQNSTCAANVSHWQHSITAPYHQNVSHTLGNPLVAAVSVLANVTTSIGASVLPETLCFDFNYTSFIKNTLDDNLSESVGIVEKGLAWCGIGEYAAKISGQCGYYGLMFLCSTMNCISSSKDQEPVLLWEAMCEGAFQMGSMMVTELMMDKIQTLIEDTGRRLATESQPKWKRYAGKVIEKTGTFFPNLCTLASNLRDPEGDMSVSFGVAGVGIGVKVCKGLRL